MSDTQTCSTCKYWSPSVTPDNKPMERSQCHRFPPTASSGYTHSVAYPATAKTDFCGEWKKAEGPK